MTSAPLTDPDVPRLQQRAIVAPPSSVAASASVALWLGRGLAALWFAYLLVTPTLGVDWIDSWHNEQRMLEVILLAVGVPVLALAALDPRLRPRLPHTHWILILVFLLGAVSASRATYREAAFAEIALHLLLAALILVCAAVVAADPARSARWARRGALLLLGAYVSGVIVRYAAALAISRPLNLEVLLLGYANPRFPSALHALLLPFVAALVLDEGESRLLRRLAPWVLALIWAINLALGTRAIWFAYVVSFAMLYAACGRARLRRLDQVMLLSALAGIALYALLFKYAPAWTGIGETFTERTRDQLLWGTNREFLIVSSWEAIRAAPWLGIGPMQFAAIPNVWAAHPHNWILQLASEWGLPATLLALYGLARLARRTRDRMRSSMPPDALDLLAPSCAGLVALVYGLVDGILVMPVSQAAAALVLGHLLGTLAAHRPTVSAPAGPRGLRFQSGILALTILVAAAVQLTVFSAGSVATATALEATQRIYATRALWPRFWSDGLLPLRKN